MKKYIVLVIVVVVSYVAGRYSAPEKVRTETVTVEVEKEVVKKKKQIVKVKENTDGSKETVIITDTETDEKSRSHSEMETKEVTSRSKFNISVLAGTSVPINMVFGVSATKPILGPIMAGAWGLSNGTVGLSLGINF